MEHALHVQENPSISGCPAELRDEEEPACRDRRPEDNCLPATNRVVTTTKQRGKGWGGGAEGRTVGGAERVGGDQEGLLRQMKRLVVVEGRLAAQKLGHRRQQLHLPPLSLPLSPRIAA